MARGKLRALELSSGSGRRADFQGLFRYTADAVARGSQCEESCPRLSKAFPKELRFPRPPAASS